MVLQKFFPSTTNYSLLEDMSLCACCSIYTQTKYMYVRTIVGTMVHCYLSKTAKFPFRGMDYSPWSWKNSIDRNYFKKFMQVGIDVKCMHTNFGGRGLSGFGDKISLWSIKVEKFNRSELAQKIHATRG